MTKESIGVGLVGFGTIGTGVAKVLTGNADVIERRLGFPLRLVRIADLDTESERGVDLGGIRFDADTPGLLADPEVDIVVELVGGYDFARSLTLDAISQGKHVVTANKALLAVHGQEIFEASAGQGVGVAFEAAVGGGIPILRALREGLAANRIESVYGILNGTTNFVLTEMERTGEEFEVILKQAQDLGYAEADPTFDVEGVDAAHKLALLTSMSFGSSLDFKSIPTEGISGLVPLDFEMAREFGYRIKLLGIAKQGRRADGSPFIEARVHPTMIPRGSLLADVDGAMNAVAVRGDAVGPTLYYGAGAGELPTASAVVGDLMEIARGIRGGVSGRAAPLSYPVAELTEQKLIPLGELVGRCYLRFTAVDRPGVLAHITNALGQHGISIEAVSQRGRGHAGASVPVILLTHPAKESNVRAALDEIDGLSDVTAPSRMVRIEEEL
ncbi:MAG: homoserine dehydrogenase [Deltaproteobacteria bacterium]|nr:homoserine dehydrogenase [Deltaproteobacteria bacterium]MBW2419500.1 homoserine dehydrogenase [Deltaproteobacteria bacterium]